MADKIPIIIADDFPLSLAGLRQVVETDPRVSVVAECGDGECALQRIKELNPSIAVLDISMPRMDGLQVAKALNSETTSVSIILLTMYREREILDRALDLGVKGYVLKDSAAEDIIRAIHTVFDGEYFISPALSTYLVEANRTSKSQKSPADHGMSSLSKTERKVLDLIAEYRSSKEIAEILFISPRTVETHRTHICQKLGLHGSHALMKFALSQKSETSL